MNYFKKLLIATLPFRRRFGTFNGTRLWITFLKEKLLASGQVFKVYVPGIIHPIHLRAHTSDIEVFSQIFVHAELDNTFNFEVKYAIDAGANIGLASIFIANRFPSAIIDAVELSASNIQILKLNSSHYPNIRVIEKGLWPRKTTLKISNPNAEPWAFMAEETHSSDPNGIQTVGVIDLLADNNVDYVDILKIDIEGAEKDLFDSSATNWVVKVRCLMIEIHDHIRPGCSTAINNALSIAKYNHKQRGEYHVYEFIH